MDEQEILFTVRDLCGLELETWYVVKRTGGQMKVVRFYDGGLHGSDRTIYGANFNNYHPTPAAAWAAFAREQEAKAEALEAQATACRARAAEAGRRAAEGGRE